MPCFAERPAHLDRMFRSVAARYRDEEALVLDQDRITYAELDRRVQAVSVNLASRGLARGDRLALILGNRFEFVYLILACARLGAIAVPLNTRHKRPEIAFVLNDCGAKMLVHEADLAAEVPLPDEVPDLGERVACGGRASGSRPFEALLAAVEDDLPAAAVGEEDTACILYTSGTTGRPKGAMLTHFGIIHSAMHFETCMALGPGERCILAVPASHVTGLVAILLAMIRVGGTTILMPAFKAAAFLALAVRERLTYSVMVPAMYNLCLLEPDFAEHDLSSWRIGGYGGAPMPTATIDKLARTLPGLILMNAYGATETTSPATIMPAGETATHADSVGTVVPCGEVRIMDDEGREVAPGEDGEIWISGPMVVPGYWNNPAATKDAFVGGYWRSGDIGSLDEEGFLRVHDRKKDMINRAGYKVYSAEVENVLSAHPDVIECAVVGRPDPVLGERVHAYVVAASSGASAEALRSFCAERLSDYKVPESFAFLSAPLPRNANGKVLKAALRAKASENGGAG